MARVPARFAAAEFRQPESASAASDLVDPALDPAWDAAVASHRQSSIFHTAAWAKVLQKTYEHEAVYLSLAQNGQPAALLPIMQVVSAITGRRGVSLPFSDVCGALFSGEGEMQSLTPRLAALARERRWKHLEIRDSAGFQVGSKSAPTFFGHTLSLKGDVEALRAGLSSAVRRGLNKAERSGLTIEVAQTRSAVSEFYQLHVRTRRRHGAPPQPLRFFNNIHRYIIQPGMGFVVIARRAAQPIASAIFFHYRENAVYKFGASDERQQEYRANNLVMWEAIKHLCACGLQRLHFGRTSPENDGLRRFKLSWGAEEEAIHYRRLNPQTEQWTSVPPASPSLTAHLFRRLPMRLNRWAGSLLYPHLD